MNRLGLFSNDLYQKSESAKQFDFKKITKKRWYIAIFLISPLIFLLSSMWVVWSGALVLPALLAASQTVLQCGKDYRRRGGRI